MSFFLRKYFKYQINQSMSFLGTVLRSWSSLGRTIRFAIAQKQFSVFFALMNLFLIASFTLCCVSCHPLLIKLFACSKWDATNACKFFSTTTIVCSLLPAFFPKDLCLVNCYKLVSGDASVGVSWFVCLLIALCPCCVIQLPAFSLILWMKIPSSVVL